MNQSLNTNNKILISVQELIYLLYFGVMFGARAIGLYEGLLIYNISLVIGMFFFCLKILVTKHSIIEYIIMTLLLGEALLVYANSGEKGILLYYTLILGMKNVSRKRLEKYACIIISLSFTILTFLTSLKMVNDITYSVTRFGEILRHSLGYPYPNTLMTTYIILIMLIFSTISMQTKKHLICASIFFEFIGILLYIYSVSNTGIIVTTFYLLINYYFQTRKNFSTNRSVLINMIYPLCIFIAIPLPFFTIKSEHLSKVLTKLTHSRWMLSQYYLSNEKISLFGSRFDEVFSSTGYAYMIDSSFLYSFLQVGLVTFIIVTILHLGMIKYHTTNSNNVEIAIIISLCLLGLSDPFLFNLSYKNILFVYIGEWFWLLLQKYQPHSIWNIDIQILKCDKHSFYFYDFCIIKHVYLTIKKNCIHLLINYIITTICIATALNILTWGTFVDSFVDSIPEWEYLRHNIAIGHWISIIETVIISITLTVLKKDR